MPFTDYQRYYAILLAIYHVTAWF